MKRLGILLVLALFITPASFAQDDFEEGDRGSFGVFLNYTRLQHADMNFVGAGARLGFNVHPNVQIEGEVAYDWRRSRTDTVDVGGIPNTVRSELRLLHGLIGPKFQTTGPVRVYGTVKGGILNFGLSQESVPAGFVGAIEGIPGGDNNGVLYPAAGIEAYFGFFGVRVEAGDEIYFDDGANHNFRLTVGPQFRW